MGGLGGLRAWQWVFAIDGLLTCLIAVIGYMLLVKMHTRHASSCRSEKLVLYFTKSIEIVATRMGLRTDFPVLVAYLLAFFMPINLSAKLGFSVGASQALSTPPYFLAAILMYTEGWLGDKWQVRSPIIVYNSLQTIVGLCLLQWVASPGVQ
ncbi:hypothetical protein N7481_001661 [Penicillium waksmanii]|uniref:uncharacterized protein n=1 Tax=Penicillium waksmanii TaxID=69791 RepID=UPI002549AAC5|nr:uncharacterized protein N7481_001661 [Penicillium waksmanii]KAJ5994684.1 hypothetical protein N7481_001661 [Penicillium waksmanii]